MRVNVEWLREWVNVELDAHRLAEELTTAGLEVDAVLEPAPALEGVVVGRVTDVQPHPEAERLYVCKVETGRGKRHSVVCGAPNVRVGIAAPFAPPGTRLPENREIEVVEVRGVESRGMLCSAKELGLSDDGEGLLLLDEDAPPGAALGEYLGFDDAILDIDLTPNRGDCFSVIGIAREIAARHGHLLATPSAVDTPPSVANEFPVELAAEAAAPRFAGRAICNIDTTRATPMWMRERLRRAGIRPISPVVDVTNYVMLELGQPLHAYDLAKLSERIVVRFARGGEKLTLLDGREVALEDDVLVIADASGPIGLAGIMGGAGTAVEPETRDVFLESAYFSPQAISGRARRYGLHTEASLRFERGVDPQGQARAIDRAAELLLEIAGGDCGPRIVTELEAHLPQREPVLLRAERVRSLLGIDIEASRVEQALTLLGMDVAAEGEDWRVTPPSFRFDIAIEEDLIEEVARMVGYDEIPAAHGPGGGRLGAASEARVDEDRLADLLTSRGYTEVVTYSFVDQALDEALHGDDDDAADSVVHLANPISSDMSVMRRSLWPGLLSTARQNLDRQQRRVRVFEIGRRFRQAAGDVHETPVLAGLAAGPRFPEHWDTAEEDIDFFDVKADVEALLRLTGRADTLWFEPADHPALAPGRTARIGGEAGAFGWLGVLHPRIQRRVELKTEAVLFTLDMEPAFAARVPAFETYSRFPAVRRDLAVVVDEDVPAGRLAAEARAAAGELLKDVVVFDVYRGTGIDSKRKSVALGLILQGVSRTLTDADADGLVQSVTRRLERELGAAIRTQHAG